VAFENLDTDQQEWLEEYLQDFAIMEGAEE
jgi:hypothetical protein